MACSSGCTASSGCSGSESNTFCTRWPAFAHAAAEPVTSGWRRSTFSGPSLGGCSSFAFSSHSALSLSPILSHLSPHSLPSSPTPLTDGLASFIASLPTLSIQIKNADRGFCAETASSYSPATVQTMLPFASRTPMRGGTFHAARRSRSSRRNHASASAGVAADDGAGFGAMTSGSCVYAPRPTTSSAARTSYAGTHAWLRPSWRKWSSSAAFSRIALCCSSKRLPSAMHGSTSEFCRSFDQRTRARSLPRSVRVCAA